ncbi:MAG: hypothetical protein ACLTV6_12200 [Christensenellales bacterium]
MLKKLDWVHPRMEELGMLLSDRPWCRIRKVAGADARTASLSRWIRPFAAMASWRTRGSRRRRCLTTRT